MRTSDDILSNGTLYWIKAGRRGKIPVPLEHLTKDQKEKLHHGIKNSQYPLYIAFATLNAHYMWSDDIFEYLIADIELSIETKRKLSPRKTPAIRPNYRSILSDMRRLQAEFTSGKIDFVQVQSILDQLTWRPEQYAEWKALRDTKIKDSCEKCGKASELVLQHTVQPRKHKKILYDLIGDRYNEFQLFIEQNIEAIDLPFPESIRKVPVCPKCGSSRVRHRLRRDNYVCEKTKDYVTCKHEFDVPEFGYDERDIRAAEKKRISILRKMFCAKHDLYSKSIGIALEEIITYLSMHHTKTLCKKCAFLEDQPFFKE